MKLVIDIMGTDKPPISAIKACLDFLNSHSDLNLILIGTQEFLEPINHPRVEKIITNIFIAQNDTVLSARKKTQASMKLGFELVKNQTALGILSAGNTAVFVVWAYSILGLLNNINKPAFMPFIPTIKKGVYFNLLDVGANLEVNGNDLYQFGVMANKFNQIINQKSQPKIAILNVGTEASKGFGYHHDAAELFKKDLSLNFQGFIEPRELLSGKCDIIISDGYAGNIALKAMEGTMVSLSGVLKQEFKKPHNFLAAILSWKILKNVKKTFDYKNHGGAIVLGVAGLAVKAHGSAGYREFSSALNLLYDSAKADVIKKIA